MIQKNEVLTREDNRIALISTKRATTQGFHRTIAERELPVNTLEQTWVFDIGEEIRASRTTPNFVNTMVKIIKWLSHLGSGKIDDSRLESKQDTHHNLTIKGIGL
jgi:hypothetical protein